MIQGLRSTQVSLDRGEGGIDPGVAVAIKKKEVKTKKKS